MADKRPMSISRDRAKEYNTTVVEGEGGKKRRVTDCGDEVAVMMRGCHPEADLEALPAKHGLADKLKGWAPLNAGQKRMNLGNSIRAAIRKAAEPPKEPKA